MQRFCSIFSQLLQLRNNYSGSRNTVTLEAGHGMPCPYNLNAGHVSIIRETQ